MSKSRDPNTRKAGNGADATLRSVRTAVERSALVGRELKDASAAINSLRADVINLMDRVRKLEGRRGIQRRTSPADTATMCPSASGH